MRAWPSLYIPQLPEQFNVPDLSLYDTADQNQKKIPLQTDYRLYVCGITPYDATHLGHAATYITFDIINRYLRARGGVVHFVQNITDIDDPLLERARRDSVDWQLLAHSQIELFRSDMSALHVLPPENYVGVTEAMPIVIDAVESLIRQGTTYEVAGDIYFRVHADRDFGSRSHLEEAKARELFAERGGDPERVGKENPFDALIWLRSKPFDPTWESPMGAGRPGWHIECSAIALRYLDSDSNNREFSLDIQGGGSDLIFPHHEMSAAQSRILSGKPFARHYVHAGMIGLDGTKMSKSLGNLLFVSKLINEGVPPMAIRWALLNRHYREDFMWSKSHLDSAIEDIQRLQLNLSRVEVAPTDGVITTIIQSLADDLNSPQAIATVRNWCEETEKGARGGNAGELSRAIDALLGIAL